MGDSDDAPAGTNLAVDAATLEQRLAQSEALVRNNQPTVQLGGYVDLGYFVPEGDGVGYVEDFGHSTFRNTIRCCTRPTGFGWVFLGDILAPAVNTRGEVADLGRAGRHALRQHQLARRARLHRQRGERDAALGADAAALVSASVNFTPRTGRDFRLGDVFDVDIAQVEWLPTESQETSLFAGKIDPVIGIEYRDRKSDAASASRRR